jgi:hypothetical protein
MTWLHTAAAALCVVAAAVHLGLVRDSASRAGHAVMLAAMVALALGMDRGPVLVACMLVLAAVGGRLLVSEHSSSRACALDAVGCAVLAGVTALTMPREPAMTHEAMGAMQHAAALSWPMLIGAVLVGPAWAVLGRVVDRSRARLGQVASGLMIGGMALMALR